MEYCDALKIMRGELGYSQTELANNIHTSVSTVSRWELGRTLPNRPLAALILELAQVNGVSAACLDDLKSSYVKASRKRLKVWNERKELLGDGQGEAPDDDDANDALVQTLLKIDYESISVIDAQTGEARPLIEGHLSSVIEEQIQQGDHVEGVAEYLRKNCADSDVESVILGTSLPYVKERLETEPYYQISYTLKTPEGLVYKRALYTYFRDDKKAILCAMQNLRSLHSRNSAGQSREDSALRSIRRSSGDREKRSILILEDNAVERRILTGLLSEEYTVIAASGGKRMFSVLRQRAEGISAIILDLVMPGMDGFEVLSRLRESEAYSRIPVIISTALTDEESLARALALGAAGYTLKPYNKDILLHMLRNCIDLREQTAQVTALRKDELTGLPNRAAFFEQAEEMIQAQEPGYYVLACFDVENFKVINDQYGTAVGDEVLIHIADTVGGFVRGIDGLFSRYTGDKFAILYPAAMMGAQALTENHRQASAPTCIPRPLRIRIGRYVVKDKAIPVSAMFDRAALAEQLAKGRYDTYIVEYTNSMREELLNEQRVVNDMVVALAKGEFEPWFQPQYNHATGALIGSEALVRWRKNGKIVSPNTFVEIFERNGFIYEVDKSIWRQVCVLLRRWLDKGETPLPVSVNISRYDMFQSDFIDVISSLVREYQLPVELLRLEITESAFSAATDVITEIAGKLINNGFTVEIDDFGSGYSSLNTLKDVPASILKLDMRFFETTENSERGGSIVESVVRMAKWLGMAVIAEGVEDKAQADYLKSIGCYYIQGYYYSKPLPMGEYEKLMEESIAEPKLPRVQKLDTLDNNLFWDPKSMETLIFNSYVGGACIFEYYRGKAEMLRVNDQYIAELHGLIPEGSQLKDASIVPLMDAESKATLVASLQEALDSGKEATCHIQLHEGSRTEYLSSTCRVIAKTADRTLYYLVIHNITEQRELAHRQRESAQRLKVIMDNVAGGVSAIKVNDDGTSQLLFHNEKYFELYGYTIGEAVVQDFDPLSYVIPEDYSGVMEKLRALKNDGKSMVIDHRIVKTDGSYAQLRANSSMMEMEGYGPVIISVLLDVTQQRTLEEQLRAVVDNINGGVSAVYLSGDKGTEFVFANDKYFEITGYTREQFSAEVKSVMELVHPEDRERVRRLFIEASANKRPYTMEYRIIRRNGAVRYILCNTSVIQFFGVDHPVQLAVSNDVTNLRAAQERERELLNRFQTVLDTMITGLTAAACRGENPEFLFGNDYFFKLNGVNRADFEGKFDECLKLVHPDDRESFLAVIQSTNQVGQKAEHEHRIVWPDGTVHWVKVFISVTDMDGVSVPVQVVIYVDITQRKEADEQLHFLNASAHEILAQPDSDKAINDTLSKLMNYFAGDRAYIFELDDGEQTSDNTYEICAPGVRPEIDKLKGVPYATQQYWFDAFHNTGFVVIPDIAAIDESQAAMRELLLAQSIRSIIVAPLWRDDRLIGYMGIDNPTVAADQVGRLIALTDYFAILLTRRDLMQRVEHDRETVQLLMDDTPGGFLRMEIHSDKAPTVVSFNQGFCKLLGMTRDELMAAYGDNIFKCLLREDIEPLYKEMAAAVATGGQYTCKCRVRKMDGSLLLVMVFGRLVKDENGKSFLNSYFTDITQKKEMEQLQNELLENLPSGAALYEFDGEKVKVIHINKHYWELVGRNALSPEEISIFGVFHPEDRAAVLDELRSSIRQGRNARISARIICGDGGYKPFAIVTNNVREEGGKYLLYATFNPISDEAMSIQEMLPIALSTMVESTDDMSYVKDKELRYLCVSSAVVEMAGAESRRDLVGKSAEEVFGGDFAGKFTEDDRLVLESGEAKINMLEHIPMRDGHIRLARTSKYPIMDASGHAVGVYCVSHDITSQKETESQLSLLTAAVPGGLAAYSISDHGFKTLFFNEGFYSFSGYSREEYMAMSEKEPLALVVPEDRPALLAMVQRFNDEKRDGMRGDCSYRCRTKGGDIRHMQLRGVLSQVGEDAFVLNVVQTDVTEQLEASERQAALLDNLPFGAAMYEFDGKSFTVIHINRQYSRIADRQVDQSFEDFDPMEAIHPHDRMEVLEELRSAIKEGRNASGDIRLLYGREGYHFFHLDARIVPETGGKYLLYVAYQLITDQERKLKETSDQLRLLSASIPGGIATFRCQSGSIQPLFINQGIAELTGYSSEEFESGSVSVLGIIFDEDRGVIHRQIEMLVAGETALDYNVRIHTKDGGYKWVDCMANVTKKESKCSFIVSAVLTDVTQKYEEAERLRVSEELNRLAIDQSGKIISRYDVAAKTLFLPDTLPEKYEVPQVLYNMPQEQVELGRVSADTAEAYCGLFNRIENGDASGEAVYQQRSTEGWRWLRSQFTTVFSGDGKPVYAVVSFTDITEQRSKEAIYSRWLNSIETRPSDSYTLVRCNLNKANVLDSWEGGLLRIRFTDPTQSINSRTREYAGRFVHGDDRETFRRFLNSETMLAEYHRGHRSDSLDYREQDEDGSIRWLRLNVDLVEYPDSTDVEAYLMFEDIDEEKRSQLSTIQRAETDPLTGVLNRTAFAQGINRIIAHYGPDTHHALFMLDIDGFKQVNDIFGHGAGDQILTEIADALTNYTRSDDLVCRLGGDEFFVFLSNIPSEDMAAKKARQICDISRRTLSSTVKISASIGVALYPQDGEGFEALYKAADQALYRTKEAGKNGYSFSFGQPTIGADAQWHGRAAAAPSAMGQARRRILLVDDSKASLTTLENILKAEYQIEKAADGATALAKLKHYGTAISAVLLDLMMPGMSGFEVLEQIQLDERIQSIPVIVVSADEDRETALRVIQAGASDLITKPVDPDLLRIRVESAVSKAENQQLRAQNSYLSIRNSEVSSYRSALEYLGALVITLDWSKGEFSYSPNVSKKLSGVYDDRTLWRILLSDMVADPMTVKKMQQLVHDVAEDRERSDGRLTVRLKTASKIYKMFDFMVFKETNDFGLADKMIMTLKETVSASACQRS